MSKIYGQHAICIMANAMQHATLAARAFRAKESILPLSLMASICDSQETQCGVSRRRFYTSSSSFASTDSSSEARQGNTAEGAAVLSHTSPSDGSCRMVDVADKPLSRRRAVASAQILLSASSYEAIINDNLKKGDVFSVARIAGINGAKQTASIIPMCHSILLDHVHIDIQINHPTSSSPPSLSIHATALTSSSRTGVEMEALCAVSCSSLAIYDMIKSVCKYTNITNIRLEEKEGGKQGHVFYNDGGNNKNNLDKVDDGV